MFILIYLVILAVIITLNDRYTAAAEGPRGDPSAVPDANWTLVGSVFMLILDCTLQHG